MAHARYGVASPQWWDHLRDWKRVFWRSHRRMPLEPAERDEIGDHTPGASKKNTKRWCRGRVGREHKPVNVDYATHKNVGFKVKWRITICSVCNKELRMHW